MKLAVETVVATLILTSVALAQEQPGAGGRVRPGASAPPPQRASPRRPVIPPPTGPNPLDPLTVLARRTQAAPIDLAGTWTGLYAVNDTIFIADLTMSADDADKRHLTGQVHVTTIPAKPAVGPTPAPAETTWKIEGRVDPGDAAVFFQHRGFISQPPGSTMPQISFAGVYSAERKEIAGQTWTINAYGPTSPYFLFARSENAAAIKAFAAHAAQSLSRLTAGDGAPPSDEEIAKWADKYEQEYPGSVANDSLDKVVLQSLPLLNDATFKPVFSQPYDTIDYGLLALSMQRVGAPVARAPRAAPGIPGEPGQRVRQPMDPAARQQAVQDAIVRQQAMQAAAAQAIAERNAARAAGRAGGRGPAPAPVASFATKYMFLQYVLRPAPARVIAAAAMRTEDAWESEQLAHYQKSPAISSTFDDLAALEAALPVRRLYAWPSEKKAWPATIEAFRTQLAGATLAANVQHETSTAAGKPGAELLATWATDNAVLLKHVPDADRVAAQARIDDKLDAVLDGLLAQPRAAMAAFPSGGAALRAGALWYDTFFEEFHFAATRPPVKKILADLHAERDRDLSASLNDFIGIVAHAESLPAVASVFSSNFGVPGDATLHDLPKLKAAADERKFELDQAHMMSLFSEDEKKLMDKPGHIDLTKARGAKPSPDDVRLAFLRMYAASNGELLDDHSAKFTTRMGSMLFIPFSCEFKLNGFKVLEVVPGRNEGEFDCTFTADIECHIPHDNAISSVSPPTQQGMDSAAAMMNVVLHQYADEQRQLTIILDEKGWRPPNIDLVSDMERGLDNLLPK